MFNRAYFPIENAITEFLGDAYEPAAVPGRYSYIPADSVAGVVIYDDRFVYSFHASDPACERLSNAFDIVRAHKFGDLDEKESYKAMCEFAQEQPAVKALLAEEREKQAQYDFDDADDDWKSKLNVHRMEDVICKIVTLEDEINAEIDRLVDLKRDIH